MQPDRFTIKSQEAVVAPVLTKLGADPGSVRSEANAALDALPTVSQGGEAAGPSSELVRVLRDAEGEMRALKDEYVSTEHILLALAGHPSRAGDALRAHGATKDQLLQAIKEVRGPHRVTDQGAEDKYQAL